jgi:hypothetical protein
MKIPLLPCSPNGASAETSPKSVDLIDASSLGMMFQAVPVPKEQLALQAMYALYQNRHFLFDLALSFEADQLPMALDHVRALRAIELVLHANGVRTEEAMLDGCTFLSQAVEYLSGKVVPEDKDDDPVLCAEVNRQFRPGFLTKEVLLAQRPPIHGEHFVRFMQYMGFGSVSKRSSIKGGPSRHARRNGNKRTAKAS